MPKGLLELCHYEDRFTPPKNSQIQFSKSKASFISMKSDEYLESLSFHRALLPIGLLVVSRTHSLTAKKVKNEREVQAIISTP